MQSRLSPPWCLNDVLQVKAYSPSELADQQTAWEKEVDEAQFKACLFQKASFNFLLFSMLLQHSFLKHTTSLPTSPDVSKAIVLKLMVTLRALSRRVQSLRDDVYS